jgi:acyl-CoA synthetase (NDP forming)
MQYVSETRGRIYERVCELVEKFRKPVFAVGTNFPRGKGAGKSDFALAQFRTPERAAKAAGVMYQYYKYRKRSGQNSS